MDWVGKKGHRQGGWLEVNFLNDDCMNRIEGTIGRRIEYHILSCEIVKKNLCIFRKWKV
jgi:hypothetical protein